MGLRCQHHIRILKEKIQTFCVKKCKKKFNLKFVLKKFYVKKFPVKKFRVKK